MGLFEIFLVLAAFLCSLVAGFLFAFAIVVMPGIKGLGNREYIRAFQVIDGVIQNNQPLFIVVWIGSIMALIIAAVFSIGRLDAIGYGVLALATLIYLLGVQLPTFAINIPLNNMLQSMDVDTMDGSAQEAARNIFEVRWNRWNVIRTVLSCLVSALLMVLMFRY
ncbi:MAG: DUF1772 domain-containing protein [Anaerolineales bacterium]